MALIIIGASTIAPYKISWSDGTGSTDNTPGYGIGWDKGYTCTDRKRFIIDGMQPMLSFYKPTLYYFGAHGLLGNPIDYEDTYDKTGNKIKDGLASYLEDDRNFNKHIFSPTQIVEIDDTEAAILFNSFDSNELAENGEVGFGQNNMKDYWKDIQKCVMVQCYFMTKGTNPGNLLRINDTRAKKVQEMLQKCKDNRKSNIYGTNYR